MDLYKYEPQLSTYMVQQNIKIIHCFRINNRRQILQRKQSPILIILIRVINITARRHTTQLHKIHLLQINIFAVLAQVNIHLIHFHKHLNPQRLITLFEISNHPTIHHRTTLPTPFAHHRTKPIIAHFLTFIIAYNRIAPLRRQHQNHFSMFAQKAV